MGDISLLTAIQLKKYYPDNIKILTIYEEETGDYILAATRGLGRILLSIILDAESTEDAEKQFREIIENIISFSLEKLKRLPNLEDKRNKGDLRINFCKTCGKEPEFQRAGKDALERVTLACCGKWVSREVEQHEKLYKGGFTKYRNVEDGIISTWNVLNPVK